MRRIFVLMALVAMMAGVVAPSATHAQTSTPGSGEAAGSFGIPLGSTVTLIGADGVPAGTMSITAITDPFQGYDASSAPMRGYHYALVEVTVTNTGSGPMVVDPNSIEALDSDGFIAEQPYVNFADSTVTPLEYTDALAPGESVSGAVVYELFGDMAIQQMVYVPQYGRLISVLDLRTAPVALGTPVSIIGSDGSEVAQVTVDGVTAPFTGFDPSSAPPRGTGYVALEVTVTNTSAGVLSVSPADFWLIDRDGFALSSTYVSRTDTTVPDYDFIDLNPGESQHGMIFYSVFEGVPAAQVVYGDGYTTLTVVADLAAGGSQAESGSAGQPGVEVTPTVAAPPTAEAIATTAASSADCAGLIEWANDLADRVGSAAALVVPFQTADVSTLDAATVRDVGAQMRAMGDEQAASNPPAAAEELNTLMTEQFYYALADAIDQIANGIEQQNAASALAGQMAAQKVVGLFADGGPYDVALDALELACPVEMEQLNNMDAGN